MQKDRTLSENPVQDLIARLRRAAGDDRVSVRDLLEAAGSHSFDTLLFAVSLIMVTPLSGIPTLPTLGALVILLIAGQWALGRDHLWLPDWLMRRAIETKRFCNGLDWTDKPARVIDRHTHIRLQTLVKWPLNYAALLVVLAVVVTWPFLELLPFFTTTTALGIAFLALGLMTHDGLWIIAGYAYLALLAGGIFWVI